MVALVLCLLFFSCEKFVRCASTQHEISWRNSICFRRNGCCRVTGIFQTLAGSSIAGSNNGLSVILGLSGDELKLFSTSNSIFNSTYKNQLTSNSIILFWTDLSYYFISNQCCDRIYATIKLFECWVKKRLIAGGEVYQGVLQS